MQLSRRRRELQEKNVSINGATETVGCIKQLDFVYHSDKLPSWNDMVAASSYATRDQIEPEFKYRIPT